MFHVHRSDTAPGSQVCTSKASGASFQSDTTATKIATCFTPDCQLVLTCIVFSKKCVAKSSSALNSSSLQEVAAPELREALVQAPRRRDA